MYFCDPVNSHTNGRLAEWLGNGLQNRVQRFESATDLNTKALAAKLPGLGYFIDSQACLKKSVK